MDTLLQLPHELLRCICAHLPLQELKHIRLTCKTLASVGVEMLLPELEVLYTLESLERLRAISLDPVLRLHVTSLVYTADRIRWYPDGCFREWKAEVQGIDALESFSEESMTDMNLIDTDTETDDESDELSSQNQPSDMELWRGWEAYRDLRDDQEVIRCEQLDRMIFVESVVRLARLRSIRVSIWDGHSRRSRYAERTFEPTLTKCARGSPGTGPGSLYQLSDSAEIGVVLAPWAKQSTLVTNDERTSTEELEAHRPVSKLTDFSVQGPWGDLAQLDDITHSCQEAFSQLRNLQILFTCHMDFDTFDEEMEMLEALKKRNMLMRSMMRAAPQLKSLQLGLSGHRGSMMVCTELQPVLSDMKWCHIEYVSLAGFRFTERDIISFLDCHGNSLKGFVLKDMYLENGKLWCSFADLIRKLKPAYSVRFKGRLHIKDDKPLVTLDTGDYIGGNHGITGLGDEGETMSPTDRIEKYICGLSDINPLQAAYNDEYGKTYWPLGERPQKDKHELSCILIHDPTAHLSSWPFYS